LEILTAGHSTQSYFQILTIIYVVKSKLMHFLHTQKQTTNAENSRISVNKKKT